MACNLEAPTSPSQLASPAVLHGEELQLRFAGTQTSGQGILNLIHRGTGCLPAYAADIRWPVEPLAACLWPRHY